MRKTICIVSLICILLLYGCDCSCDAQVHHWKFQQDSADIDGLYIVDAENPYNYEIIKEIPLEKYDELLDDIKSLEYRKYGWNLHTTWGMCFVVKYSSGEYDIISWWEPMHLVWEEPKDVFSNTHLIAKISWLKCNEKQFNELIEKYNVD